MSWLNTKSACVTFGLIASFGCGKTTADTDSSGGNGGQGGNGAVLVDPQIACGTTTACFLDTSGEVTCWGDDWGYSAPPGPFQQISIGPDYACAIDANDQLVCWGGGFTNGSKELPSGKVTAVSAGGGTYCVSDTEGKTSCFSTWQAQKPPEVVPPFVTKNLELDVAEPHYACVVNAQDHVATCAIQSETPWSSPPQEPLAGVSVSNSGACAVTGVGAVACWGPEAVLNDPNHGFLGTLPSGAWTRIDTGHNDGICGLHANGALECWGRFVEIFAQDSSEPPVSVPTAKVTSFCVGFQFGCAIMEDNSIGCWGYNADGVLDPPI